MGKYGLPKCPVFKEDGDAWETAPFGERRGTYTHKGVDIVRHVGCNTTATVTAIADGTVIGVRTTVTGVNHAAEVEGNYVAIDHGGGMVTKYFHLRYGSIPAAIRKGAKVKAGDTVGYMGNTGDSYGAHLHFQLEQDGKPIDGAPYLKGEKVIGSAKPTLDADLAKLTAAKVITSPDYWKKTAPTVRYLPELLHNMAEALK